MQFQREKFIHFFDEALPLFREHHAEVGNYFNGEIEFDPDVESYTKLDDADALRCFTVREGNSLIGYCIHHVHTHLHFCNSKQSVQDAIFIAKNHRGIGRSFIDWVDVQLRAEGVDAVYHYVSINHNYNRTLLSLGYKKIESTYLRRLN